MAEPVHGAAASPIEVVPVVVLSQVFTARPSSIPDIRDFVRRCLAESPLTAEGNREVGETVFRALLDAAGPTGSIQVAFRIFPEHVEVDVLRSDTAITPPTMPGPPIAIVQPTQVAAQPAGADPRSAQAAAAAGGPGRAAGPGRLPARRPGRRRRAPRPLGAARAVSHGSLDRRDTRRPSPPGCPARCAGRA